MHSVESHNNGSSVNVDTPLSKRLNTLGTYLRRHFRNIPVTGPSQTPGGEGFRFDIQQGAGSYRLWVRYDIQWVTETDIAALLDRWNLAGKLREAGTGGSVVLNSKGASVRTERKPPDLGD